MPESNSSYQGGSFSGGMFDFGASAINIGLQNLWNQKLIKEQNEYNSPKSQMARYQAAGLNPNLIYGQGNSGNQTMIPEIQGPLPSTLSASIQKMLAVQAAKKQLRQMDKQTELLDQTISEKYQKTYNMTIDAVAKRLNNLKMETESKYWDNNAKYQNEFLKGKLRTQLLDLSVKQAQQLNYGLDAQLKRDVHLEKSYYNQLRQKTGLDRNDSMWFRGGYNLGNKAYDFLSDLFK